MATTNDHVRVRTKLRALHKRHARTTGQLDQLEDERTKLYLEARALDPPMTFKEIADIFGVTEAAVMQKVKRHASKPKAKRARANGHVS